MITPASATLLSIVQVDKGDRIVCQEPGCGHSVWRAIHVVEHDGKILVLGSHCFERRYGSGSALGAPSYGTGTGRQLTPEERQLLQHNTRELIARFETEREQLQVSAAAKLMAMKQAVQRAPVLSGQHSFFPQKDAPFEPARGGQWGWQKVQSSMAYFRLNDGTGWVRVQHKDGRQMLAPYPVFDGWDEAFPSSLGTVDKECAAYAIEDIQRAVAYLRANGRFDLVTGVWREIVQASRRPIF